MIIVRSREKAATADSLQIGPESVKTARDFAVESLRRAAVSDTKHADDVRTVVSELATNAIKYGTRYGTNINVEISIWPKWSVISVDDRDPAVYEPTPSDDDFASLGMGLAVVRSLAERFWWKPKEFSKTANAIVLRTDVKLRRRDRAILRRLEDPDE